MTPTDQLYEWLDITFNDFYCLTELLSADFNIIEHKPETPNEKMKQLICELNKIKVEEFDKIAKIQIPDFLPGYLVIMLRGPTLILEPFDNYIYHTEYMEENNG